MRNTLSINFKLAGMLASACLLCAPLDAGVPGVGKHAWLPEAHPSADLPEPDRLHFISLDFPGFDSLLVHDINNSQVVAGEYGSDPSGRGPTKSFLYHNGQIRSVENPGAQITLVGTITNSGLMFGNWGSETVQHAGFYDPTTNIWTALPDVPGKPVNIGWRANDLGSAVGNACEGSIFNYTNCLAWIWNGRAYTFFSVPGALDFGTYPQSINNQNEVVGYFLDGQTIHSFKKDATGFTVIDLPRIGRSAAFDINNVGQILMLSPLDNPLELFRPMLLDKGIPIALRPFPDENQFQTIYGGMNDTGDFVGQWYMGQDPTPHSFVAVHKVSQYQSATSGAENRR